LRKIRRKLTAEDFVVGNTWEDYLMQASTLSCEALIQYAIITSVPRCHDCFCCACAVELEKRAKHETGSR
jgi:hypothetical protein